MNNLPREQLIKIIQENGISIANNPQQCKAFLLDYCGEYRLEINVLMSALQEGVVKELKNISQGIPLESILAKLRQQLETNLGIREDIAQWAVESWALALGVIAEEDKVTEYTNLGDSLYEQGKFDEAIAQYEQEIRPKHTEKLQQIEKKRQKAKTDFQMGNTYFKQGKYLEAADYYDLASFCDYNYIKKAMRNNLDCAEAYFQRGNLFLKKEDFERAISDYEKAIGIKPNFTEAYNNCGLAYAGKKDWFVAREMFKQSLKINPTSDQVKKNLNFVRYKLETLERRKSSS